MSIVACILAARALQKIFLNDTNYEKKTNEFFIHFNVIFVNLKTLLL